VATTVPVQITNALARLDPSVRIQTIPLSTNLNQQLEASRDGAALAVILGAGALALATVGTLGVFAYAVRQRKREIGIRIALGAQPSRIVRVVLAGQSNAALWGLGVGLLGAIAASSVLRGYLFGLNPFDPITYIGVAAALTVAGLGASYLPVRHATRLDPANALRDE